MNRGVESDTGSKSSVGGKSRGIHYHDYDACGVAAAIIDKNGVTQYEKFWGSKELGTGEKPDGETIFGLASVTKSFTAFGNYADGGAGNLKLR